VAYGDGEEEAGTDGVHFAAELAEEGLKVGCVGLVGELPVDVDAVKEMRRGDAGCEVSFDEGVDAGGDEGFAVFRLSVEGEVGGAAFERDENAQMGKATLEKLKLVEVAPERLAG
jgi:hypothetical protein